MRAKRKRNGEREGAEDVQMERTERKRHCFHGAYCHVPRRKGPRDCTDIKLNYTQLRQKNIREEFREFACKLCGATRR